MAGSIFNILFDELQRIWRYRWLVIGIAALLFTAAAAYIVRIPNVYEASAQLFVNKETPVSAAAHGVSLVGENFGSSYVVQKTLLNDKNLRNALVRLNPQAASMDQAALQKALAALRAKIRIDPDQGDGFIQIHFQDADPVRARDVVQLLLDQFIAANITRNREELRRAGEFLDQQIVSYAAKSRAADDNLMAFARAHPRVVSQAGPDAADAATDVANAQSAYSAALMARQPTAAPARDDSQVNALRARIATLRTEYTDQYPDVVAAQRQLTALLAAQSAVVPEVQQKVAAEPTSVREARGALAAAQARLRQARQGPPPSPRDAEWADLKKRSAILRGNYEEMLSRREATHLSEAVYADKNSGKYQVTSPPVVPPLPIGPNRRLYLLLAAVAAFGIGVAAAYLRGSINGIFVASRELEEAFGLPVAGTVSLEKAWQTGRLTGAGRSLLTLAIVTTLIGPAAILTVSRYMAARPFAGGDINSVQIDLRQANTGILPRDQAK